MTLALVLVTDRHGMLLRVSASAYAILGWRSNEMVGKLANNFLYPLDLDSTREHMRAARRGATKTEFECRYSHRNGDVVDLRWAGKWVEKLQVHVFVGHVQPVSVRTVMRRLDVLDGFQITKGLYALSLAIAWLCGYGSHAFTDIERSLATFDGGIVWWMALMAAYGIGCLSSLVWKRHFFQLGLSFVSVFVWTWAASVTLISPGYVPAAGVYEAMLGAGSVASLYFRGTRLL